MRIECWKRRSHPRFASGSHVAEMPSPLPVALPRDGLSAAYGVHGAAPLRQRQLAAHRDPDAVGVLGVDAAERAPRPSVVRMARVGQRLGPALDDLVVAGRPVLVAPARLGALGLDC